jgi:phage terminase large subunit GpA-like protein
MISRTSDFSTERRNAVKLFSAGIKRCRPQRIRTLRQFAEAEIILPEGRFEGLRFRCHRQPFAGLLLDELPRWRRSAVTGCVQSGKSLTAWVIPILYHLFELGESVIAGVPTIEQSQDKWVKELLPVIDRNGKFRSLIPAHGRGSRGGKLESITFGNGATLKFMSGGGGDEKRSSYTSRVLICTEVDKMDESGGTSREADKISQLEARTASYGDDARVYLECTTSFKTGRIWREYNGGSESRIVSQCGQCREWVCPEREHLRGWQQATTEVDAARMASFVCPSCNHTITDADRELMCREAKLLHRGQTIASDGTISGELPPTHTLGFRWSGFQNLFWSSAFLGSKSWRRMRAEDEDNSEKEACQFFWAVPYEPADVGDTVPVTIEGIIERQARYPRGQVPESAKWVTVGVDIGKRLAHWVGMAFDQAEGTAHIHDYGRIEIASDDLGFDRAVMVALADFRERMKEAWTRHTCDGVLVDCRWRPDAVIAAIKAMKDKTWRPAQGLGDAHYNKSQYLHPDKITGDVVLIGHRWYEKTRQKTAGGVRVVMMDSNYWKSQVHERLTLPFNRGELTPARGGISLFSSMDPNEHLSFGKHLTAEREVLKFEPGRGHVKVWEAMREANHWLDAAYMALVAGVRCGFEQTPRQRPAIGNVATMPRGDTAPTFYSGGDDGFTAPTF